MFGHIFEDGIAFLDRVCRLIDFRRFSRLGPAREGLSGICDLPQRFLFEFFRRLSVSPILHRTTIEEGTTLNGKRLVMNIADDMCF